jgi:hypothetical protein
MTMAEERREHGELEEIRDPETNKVAARLDRNRERLEVKPYRGRPIWLNVRELLDKRRAE